MPICGGLTKSTMGHVRNILIVLLIPRIIYSLCVEVNHQAGEKRQCEMTTTKAVWQPDLSKTPNPDEMARILAIAKERDARTYVFLATCAHLGLRLCEVAHLRADDLTNGKLRVTRRKKRVLSPTTIDVPTPLWNLLTEWAQMFDDGEYLFPGKCKPCVIQRSRKGVRLPDEYACAGGHVSLRVIQRNWAMYCAEAGLRMEGRGIHQTRHYFATELYRATRDIRATQVALGHSSVDMTARYAHVVDLAEKINLVRPVL